MFDVNADFWLSYSSKAALFRNPVLPSMTTEYKTFKNRTIK
jgi:hypothetical protein